MGLTALLMLVCFGLTSATSCFSGRVACRDNNKCIALGHICDGKIDCRDASDEDEGLCRAWNNTECREGLARCTDNGRIRCIDIVANCVEENPKCEGSLLRNLCWIFDRRIPPLGKFDVPFPPTPTSTIGHLYCENGWLKLRSSCYFLGKDTSNWEQNRQKCLALDSDLVTITSDEEYNFLRDLAKGHSTHVGLNDLQEEGTYRWVADGTIHQIVKSWWGEGEPNNHDSREHCVHFYNLIDDRLNDGHCDDKARYICEKPAQLD